MYSKNIINFINSKKDERKREIKSGEKKNCKTSENILFFSHSQKLVIQKFASSKVQKLFRSKVVWFKKMLLSYLRVDRVLELQRSSGVSWSRSKESRQALPVESSLISCTKPSGIILVRVSMVFGP